MKQPEGSFTMHDDGEIDSRATYCAVAILRCLNIQDSFLLENVAEWILDCQTYEGGFGSVPGSEAHGGYTFCCVASLCLLNQLHRADLSALLRWLTNKQQEVEGGFCGRSNKLVDSCYSYWQGAVFPLLHAHLKESPLSSSHSSTDSSHTPPSSPNDTGGGWTTSGNSSSSSGNDGNIDSKSKYSRRTTRSSARNSTTRNQKSEPEVASQNELEKTMTTNGLAEDKLLDNWIFDCASLQDYVLNHCQSKAGLLRDKPGAIPDFYHTSYALSGLSISQHQPDDSTFDIGSQPINILKPTHPLFNVTLDNLDVCFDYFSNKRIQTFSEEDRD